ncbi:MAG: DNA polymerase III subunit delta' [bacterium]
MKTIYPWQTDQWQQVRQLIAADRIPHALLLAGPTHTGKHRFASVVAQSMLCADPVAGEACGGCKQCGLIEGGFHPDLREIQSDEGSSVIKIELIRDLIGYLGKTSQQGGWKTAIISEAEQMNASAANALLKSLEEPASRTLLILVTNDLSRLLPTIKSRCRLLRFPVPARATSVDWLAQVVNSREKAIDLLDSADGRPLWALAMDRDGFQDRRHTLENLWARVADGDVAPEECAVQCVNGDAQMAIDWLYYYVKKQIGVKNQAGVKPRSEAPADCKLFLFLDRLSEAKRQLLSPANLNPQLIWESLMLDWRGYSR